jgi:hypothetical protein
MSYATKKQKQHRREKQARDLRRERAHAASWRHRSPVLKRPPKWIRHAAKRDPDIFGGLTWRALGSGCHAGMPGARSSGRRAP